MDNIARHALKEKDVRVIMMENNHKCYFDMKSMFHPCNGMDTIFKHSKEIDLPEIMSFTGDDAGKIRNGFVSWKSSQKKDAKKIAFNICPFCGENIMNDKKQLSTDKIPFYDGGK